jgi:nucleoside permease NupC
MECRLDKRSIFFLKLKLILTFVISTKKDRSIVVATYALCGFANMASIGVQIGKSI